jgi:hypothetical protein
MEGDRHVGFTDGNYGTAMERDLRRTMAANTATDSALSV